MVFKLTRDLKQIMGVQLQLFAPKTWESELSFYCSPPCKGRHGLKHIPIPSGPLVELLVRTFQPVIEIFWWVLSYSSAKVMALFTFLLSFFRTHYSLITSFSLHSCCSHPWGFLPDCRCHSCEPSFLSPSGSVGSTWPSPPEGLLWGAHDLHHLKGYHCSP